MKSNYMHVMIQLQVQINQLVLVGKRQLAIEYNEKPLKYVIQLSQII